MTKIQLKAIQEALQPAGLTECLAIWIQWRHLPESITKKLSCSDVARLTNSFRAVYNAGTGK